MRTSDSRRRNVTLSLPEDTLRQIKIIAAQRDTSISALLREQLEQLIDQETGYHQAEERFLRRLEQGFDLGSQGRIAWSRDEVHER